MPLTQCDIAQAFPAKRLKHVSLPDVSAINWGMLDYLGWNHISGHRGYVVFHDGVDLRGIILEKTKVSGAQKPAMCSWCLTVHRCGGVNIFTTETRHDKNKHLGEYICSNLNCSLYIRGVLKSNACQMRETLGVEARISRLKHNVGKFFNMVYK